MIKPRYYSKAVIQSLKSKMPSSLNLFIRVPKGYNEKDVFDAVIRKDICKVIDVIIKKGKSKNIAIVMVDYWYKGTRDIRDTLLRSGSIAISFANGTVGLAYEYKPQKKASTSRDVNEFGRDINKKSILIAPALNVNAPVFVPMVPAVSDILHPYVTDNRAERARNYAINNAAAQDFIQEYEATFAIPEKMPIKQFTALEILANVRDDLEFYGKGGISTNDTDDLDFISDGKYFEAMLPTPLSEKQADAIAPGAPVKIVKNTDCSLAEIIRNLEDTFDQPEADADAVSEITDDNFQEKPCKPRSSTTEVEKTSKPVNYDDEHHKAVVQAVKRRKFLFGGAGKYKSKKPTL